MGIVETYLKNEAVYVKFILTSQRSRCQIIKRDYTHIKQPAQHVIQDGDKLEWMVTNKDLLNILEEFVKLDKHQVDKLIKRLRNNLSRVKADLNIQQRPVIGNFIPEAPGLFVKFPLKAMDATYLVDGKNNMIVKPIGIKIPSKSCLIWKPTLVEIETILVRLRNVTPKHKEKVEKGIFKKLEK